MDVYNVGMTHQKNSGVWFLDLEKEITMTTKD